MALDSKKFLAAMEKLQQDFPEVDLHYTVKVVVETKEAPVTDASKASETKPKSKSQAKREAVQGKK